MDREIKQAMNLKSQNIADAQKRKQNSMEMLACFRDATLLTVAQMGNGGRDVEDIENSWEYWHNWLKNKLDSEILGF